jgi:hypothetical protein
MPVLSLTGERSRDHRPYTGSPGWRPAIRSTINLPGSGRNPFECVATIQSASKLQPSVDLKDVADAYDPPSARDTVDPQAALRARVLLERDMIAPLKEDLEQRRVEHAGDLVEVGDL